MNHAAASRCRRWHPPATPSRLPDSDRTGRLWSSQVVLPALSGTADWLATHNVPADDVVFVSDKTAIHADIYIEDAPHFIADLQAAGREVITMDAPYNRRLPGHRVDTWPEIPALVANLLSRQPLSA